MTYSFGRYPVIDGEDRVVGVVTNGDLILHILERLGNVYLHNKKREEILGPSKYLLSPGRFSSDECLRHGIFSFHIDTDDLDRAGEGSQLFKRHLQEHNLPADIIRRASIALYEAEVNVVLHAQGKGEIVSCIEENQLYIRIADDGPGIENIELAMQPGFTTATDEVRARGFGAGMGLANIKKYTDKVVILSSDNGVKMEMVVVLDKGNDVIEEDGQGDIEEDDQGDIKEDDQGNIKEDDQGDIKEDDQGDIKEDGQGDIKEEKGTLEKYIVSKTMNGLHTGDVS